MHMLLQAFGQVCEGGNVRVLQHADFTDVFRASRLQRVDQWIRNHGRRCAHSLQVITRVAYGCRYATFGELGCS